MAMMGSGDVVPSGQVVLLMSCETTLHGLLGICDRLNNGGKVRRGGGGEQETCDV